VACPVAKGGDISQRNGIRGDEANEWILITLINRHFKAQ
jgi:hypothetical protein